MLMEIIFYKFCYRVIIENCVGDLLIKYNVIVGCIFSIVEFLELNEY